MRAYVCARVRMCGCECMCVCMRMCLYVQCACSTPVPWAGAAGYCCCCCSAELQPQDHAGRLVQGICCARCVPHMCLGRQSMRCARWCGVIAPLLLLLQGHNSATALQLRRSEQRALAAHAVCLSLPVALSKRNAAPLPHPSSTPAPPLHGLGFVAL